MEKLLKKLAEAKKTLSAAQKAVNTIEAQIFKANQKVVDPTPTTTHVDYNGEFKSAKKSSLSSKDRWDSECNGVCQKISIAKTAKGNDCWYFEIEGKGYNTSEGTLIKALENFPDILIDANDDYHVRYPLLVGKTFIRTRSGEPKRTGDMYPTEFSIL